MITVVENTREWEDFVTRVGANTFLHRQGWVEFNRAHGAKTWRLGHYEDETLRSVVFAMLVNAKRGKFLFVPHGPQGLEPLEKASLQRWTRHLCELAREEGCAFIRISPIVERTAAHEELFAALGYRRAPLHMHAELTTVVDLTPSLDDILLNMRKSTRQACRKGEKLVTKGEVTIESPKRITDEMYRVYEETTKRGGFVGFSREYIQDEYDYFNTETTKAFYKVIRHEGEVLSWGLWILAGERAFYHQGANILHKKIPASYLGHWEGMKTAKAAGCQTYDFWGGLARRRTRASLGEYQSFQARLRRCGRRARARAGLPAEREVLGNLAYRNHPGQEARVLVDTLAGVLYSREER